jgi:asparagine synthase (glutamine-hydrolysing)
MCGISVVVDNSDTPSASEIAVRMHSMIRHRGPDGEGFSVVEDGHHKLSKVAPQPAPSHIAAAFRRLKIIDLSENAAQPMLSAGSNVAILYNGEIYNYRELRAELEATGRRFRSAGDSEVALAAYERWGTGCFARFEGMWAIVLLDLGRGVVVISRDRFGIKPLYWSVQDKRLLLASEIKQILAVTGSATANRALVARYLRGVRQPTLEETFFEGIRAVPPATWAEVPLSVVEPPAFRRYWNLSLISADLNPSVPRYEDAVDELDSRLRDAVQSHRISDVEVGSLLSGGIDSSTLTTMLAEMDPRAPSYSFGFRAAEPEVCEMPYVDLTVREKHLRNFETTFDAAWVAANTARVVRTLEEPILGMPPLAQFRVLQLCREHGTTVLLDGQGADEIFAGYPYHQRMYLSDRRRRHDYAGLIREVRAIARKSHRSVSGFFLADLARPWLMARVARNRSGLPRWLAPGYGQRQQSSEFMLAIGDRGSDHSLVNRQAHFDIRWGNVKTILGFGDRNGMAHSLELRVPFFDRKVVELALSLPDHYKIQNGDRKRILRDVARRRVPAAVTERPDRTGFAIPEKKWLENNLRDHVLASISDPTVANADFMKPQQLERLKNDFVAGRGESAREVWRLHTLAIWASEFKVRL